jgi:hypothetical protein
MQISAQIYGSRNKNMGCRRAPPIVATHFPFDFAQYTNRPFADIETLRIPHSVIEQLAVN